jgi:hypothetical protein
MFPSLLFCWRLKLITLSYQKRIDSSSMEFASKSKSEYSVTIWTALSCGVPILSRFSIEFSLIVWLMLLLIICNVVIGNYYIILKTLFNSHELIFFGK